MFYSSLNLNNNRKNALPVDHHLMIMLIYFNLQFIEKEAVKFTD